MIDQYHTYPYKYRVPISTFGCQTDRVSVVAWLTGYRTDVCVVVWSDLWGCTLVVSRWYVRGVGFSYTSAGIDMWCVLSYKYCMGNSDNTVRTYNTLSHGPSMGGSQCLDSAGGEGALLFGKGLAQGEGHLIHNGA